jgi:uncharacterized protein (TIGR03000 family)
VRVGEGVIAQFDVPSGINPAPICPPQIEVVQTGGKGQMLYFGWGVPCVVHPGLPGGPIRYSIFLCGYWIGDVPVEVRVKYTDGSIHTVKYHFRVYDIYDSDKKEEASESTSSATIVVDLPEDAKLTIDGESTESTSARRVFITPELAEGKEYSYTLKAEVVRDGQVHVITKEVVFRAGEETEVELELAASSVAGR